MTRKFGTTSHSEIMRAFDSENRTHTFVEQIQVPSGGSGGVVTEYIKRYQLRISPEKLLVLLDSLAEAGVVSNAHKYFKISQLEARQLRAEILATLGLFEEG